MKERCELEGSEDVIFCARVHSDDECPMTCLYGRNMLELQRQRNAENYQDWAYRWEERK